MKKYLYIFYTCLYLRKTHYITLYTNKNMKHITKNDDK